MNRSKLWRRVVRLICAGTVGVIGISCEMEMEQEKEEFNPDGFAVLFSRTGEEILEASFEIGPPGAYWAVIADLVVQVPPARYNFFANMTVLRTNVSPDGNGTILIGNVPGDAVVSFQVD